MTLVPTCAIAGATDLDEAQRFLKAFGFAVVTRHALPPKAARALYGLDDATEVVELRAGGLARGAVRLVRTPLPATPRGPLTLGPHAVDVYTRDVERTRAVAVAAGGRCGPIGRYRLGPLAVAEVEIVGPSHLVVVAIEVDRRRPSLLDTDPHRLHGEVHAAVWTVADVPAALPFWRQRAGLDLWIDATVREPEVARFMGLPRADMPLRLAVLAAADGGAPRVELVTFPEDTCAPDPAGATIEAGLFAVGGAVADLAASVAALPEVSWGEVVETDEGLAVAGVAPGGVRIELRAARE